MLDLNPTFLFTWKGSRTQKLEPYHSHDHVELAFILSGTGRYRDRKSTRLNSSHMRQSRMPSSA
jgi:hypothetical protein